MDPERLTAFRDELRKIQVKSETKKDENELDLDDLVATRVGLSLFNHTAALGRLTPVWTSDVQLNPREKCIYAVLAIHDAEKNFVGRLRYKLRTEEGAIDYGACGDEDHRVAGDERSSLVYRLADEAHRRLRAQPQLGRCAAVRFPLRAVLPGPLPQRVRGECHSLFCNGNDLTIVDFHCRKLALPATSDLLRLSLYKALSFRLGLTAPDRLHVATMIAYLDPERPRLRFWTYVLSKQMDEAIMSLDCLTQVIKLLELHVTEVIT